MATPTPSTVSGPGATFSLEKVAKASTLALPGIYVCGFVVISLYEAEYGISDFTLIKVRALAAGLLFAVFSAIPALMGIRSFRILGLRSAGGTRVDVKDDSQKKYFYVLKVTEFYYQCGFVSLIFMFFFVPRVRTWIVPEAVYVSPGYFPWLILCANCVSFAIIALTFAQHQPVAKNLANKPVRCTLLVCLTFVLWVIWTIRMSDWLFFQLSAWFYLVGLSAVALGKMISVGVGFTKSDWELKALVGLSLALPWFADGMYGNIKPSFGGGSPISAKFYFQDEDPVLHSKALDAFILEETEQGYYVIKSPGKKESIFLPRSRVVSVQLGIASK